jgi:outer membrane receptor protein involved in Fe transport
VLTGGLRFLNPKLTVVARATYTSRAFIAVIDATDPANPYTPDYALVDLVANYKNSDSVAIGANVNTLFDVGYAPALSTPPTVTCTPPGIACNTNLGWTVLITMKTQF